MYKYLQFPLFLIQGIWEDYREGIGRIISYGIVNFAYKQKVDLKKVAEQLSYDYLQEKLPWEVGRSYEGYVASGEIMEEGEQRGFYEGDYIPVAIDGVLKVFEKDEDFKDRAIRHYQIHQASDFLGIELGSSDYTIKSYQNTMKELKTIEARYGAQPHPTVKKNLLFEFRDGNGDNIEVICAYLGIRSLIGQKKFASADKNTILSRMLGAKNREALSDLLKDERFRDIYDKYARRRQFDNLINELEVRNFIVKLSWGNRIYLTLPEDGVDVDGRKMELAKTIRNYRLKAVKKREYEAKEFVKIL